MVEAQNMSSELLLLEDDMAQAHLVRLAIKRHYPNYNLTHVCDGEKALEYLRDDDNDNFRTPDLILLDLKMPKMDGHEFLSIVKNDQLLNCIPVVVLTTSSSNSDKSKAYKNRANSYLVKPLNFDEFENMIKDLCTYWCGWNLRLKTCDNSTPLEPGT